MRFDPFIDKLFFQNPKVEHDLIINPNNYNQEDPKIPTFEVLQQSKDVEESNIQEYNLRHNFSKLKDSITFTQLLEIIPIVKKALKTYILIKNQKKPKIRVATKIDAYIR